jgi:hypothetical protein
MASRHRAPWKWTPPPGLLSERGTAVRLKVHNALSPLLDPGFLDVTLRRQYQPLLDPAFDEFVAVRYPKGIAIQINGHRLEKRRWSAPLQAPLEIRLLRKRKPSALGYLIRDEAALPEDRRGLAISTYGKVIRRGWDWLGMTPSAPEHVGGLIEVPELAACLTLNKGDFLRTGARGAIYLAYRKAIQEAVSKQLAAWGDARPSNEEAPPREVRPLQRDLAHLLEELAIDFPLLASLVERRAGGQKRLPLGGRGGAVTDGRAFVAATVAEAALEAQLEEATPALPVETNGDQSHAAEVSETKEPATVLPGSAGARRPAHYGLDIQFADRPDDLALGHLVESTVWVNRAHPAYRRALASRSVGYHMALTVAMALAPLAVEAANQNQFVTAFLSRWGEAIDRPAAGKRGGR